MIAIPIVVMITLSIAGFAYAHWTDLIKINGIVNTGTLNIGFVDVLCADKEYKEDLPKDVADCDCWLDEEVTDVHTNKTGYKKLWVNITNAYPSYYCEVTFVLGNLGTVPGVFKNFTLIPTAPLDFIKTSATTWEGIDTSMPGDPVVFNLEFVNLMELQLDPCNKTKAELDIHFKQTAPECHSYEFEIEIGINSWDP
jgi:hypothetical protein